MCRVHPPSASQDLMQLGRARSPHVMTSVDICPISFRSLSGNTRFAPEASTGARRSMRLETVPAVTVALPATLALVAIADSPPPTERMYVQLIQVPSHIA